MKRSNTVHIKQLLQEFIKENQLDSKLKEKRVISLWTEVLGPLAKSTENIYIKNKILFVELKSSVVRNELSMRKSTLIKVLNERVGETVITDIIFC